MNPVAPVTKYFKPLPSSRSTCAKDTAATASVPGSPAGGRLEERGAALDQVVEQAFLDRVSHTLGELEDGHPVPRRLRPVARDVDRGAELDPPLGRERNRAERAERREGRRDREVGRSQKPGEQAGLAQLGIDLLRPDDRDRHDRDARAERDLDEAAAAEPLQPVALGEGLAGPLRAL